MTKYLLNSIAFLASSLVVNAAVTVTASTENIMDRAGAEVADGRLAILVISTRDSTFGTVKAGTLSINNSASDTEFIDNVDDAVYVAFSTSTKSFSTEKQAAISNQQINLDARFTSGDSFAIYWFPTIAFNSDLSTITLTAGTEYGITSLGTVDGGVAITDWALPGDGGNSSYNQANAGAAAFRVVAIPEPTSTALLGLGGLSLLMRRRRA